MKNHFTQRFHVMKILALTLALLAIASTNLGAKEVELRGMFRSYTGMQLKSADLAVNEQTIDLTLESWGDQSRLVVNPYAYIGIGNEPELGIREAYVDFLLDTIDIRVGKQAIIWGQAEGAFITDIVSPRDLRSFILSDFREIRKGIPAVKVDYYTGAFTLEGIWIPRFVPISMPAEGSLWRQEPSLLPGAAITPLPSQLPDSSLENSELFGKIRYFGSQINWEVMGGYAWNDSPHIIGLTVTSPGPPITAEATQAYGRYAVLGGSLSATLGSVVLRSEAALYMDKPFSLAVSGMPPTISVEKHHQLQTLVGLDWSLWGIDLSAQYLFSYVFNHTSGLIDQGKQLPEFSHTFTFRMQDTFLDDRLTAKLFVYLEGSPLNALVRPALSWSIEDGVLLEGGLELFVGDEEGTFGSFTDNSLAYVSLRWYF